MLFKEVRLRALQESPLAFGSTFARESLLTDADWLGRAERWTQEGHTGLIAMEGASACGLVACFLAMPQQAEVISMWVAPSHRRSGLGSTLIGALRVWAEERGAGRMQLMVTSANEAAVGFYERLGFVKTGRTEPYPNDARLVEFEMVLDLNPWTQ